MTPALNALISRRSDPAKQGAILGVAQSVSSLARIAGPVVGNWLFRQNPAGHTPEAPFWLAAGLLAASLLFLTWAAKSGKDYPATEVVA